MREASLAIKESKDTTKSLQQTLEGVSEYLAKLVEIKTTSTQPTQTQVDSEEPSQLQAMVMDMET